MWSRLVISPEKSVLEELGTVGRSEQKEAIAGHLPAHRHEDAFEIVLVEHGQVHWWVESEEVKLNAGQVFVTRPNELHGAVGNALEPCEICWIHFKLQACDTPFQLNEEEKSRVISMLNNCSRAAIANPLVSHHFKRLLTELMTSPKRRPAILSHAFCLLDETLKSLQSAASQDVRDERVDAALLYMKENISSNITAANCAAVVGMSVSRFYSLFSKQMGISPADWINRERIEIAKSQLAICDATITEIAVDLGFSSSQYFATVFRRLTGESPSQFLSRHRGL